MSATRKPKAADRTVDIFTGKTAVEEASAAIEEVAQEATREPFGGISSEVDRWRDSAFKGQQWTVEAFFNNDLSANQRSSSKDSYRLSIKKGWLYLEAVQSPGRSYAGVMFPETDLLKLTEAWVAAAWASHPVELKDLFRKVCK